jgi:sterol desaturase/sphingolipid hydroxylase (fatty acid hydroxylase superfamily)
VLVEMAWRIGVRRAYSGRAVLTTLGLAIGGAPFAILSAVAIGLVFRAAWRITPIRLPLWDWRTWAAGFLAVEFAYYWFHRASHRVRWLWATHSVHHSAEELTLLASFRLGWTNLISGGWLIYLPLVLAGFPPELVAGLQALNLRYQFFLHTEAVGRLGPLEWVFNTPAHHRLHHASNDAYLDRNYGGVLIVFDRLFGTVATESPADPPRYGLAHRAASTNPLRVAFGEWGSMLRDAMQAPDWRSRIAALFAPPGAEIIRVRADSISDPRQAVSGSGARPA